MGHSRKRLGADGKARYTAYYDDIRGRRRSAGTFTSKKQADRAWQGAEYKVAEGRASDPARGRQTFERYVEDEWLPNHVMEATTREGYSYSIFAHLMDTFGPMRMIEILPSHVREWVNDRECAGMTPVTLRMNKTILSSIFTTALNDQVTALHPCKGVRTPPVPKKPLRIITPAEFDTFYSYLPDDVSRLLVETGIASGMRWGELAELRPKDLDLRTRIVTVSRTVVELNARYHPEGEHFLLKEYPKNREWRRIKLGAQIMDRLGTYIEEHGIGVDDLIFAYLPTEPTEVIDRSEPTGLTTPNAKGRKYRHGTLSGYSAGRCRCAHCRRAYAVYRANRRTAGADQPRVRRRWKSDGHIPRRWFRDGVLKPAFARSGIGVDVKMHALRHAHASWLLAGGADLQVVKDRLGHGSIATTERYLHTLPDADDTAVEALMKVRGR